MADDLNRWLRAVRPHTKADDDWAESSEANDALAAVHARLESGPRRWVRAWPVWLPSVGVAAIAAALVTAIVVSSPTPVSPPADSHSQAIAPIPANMRPVAQILKNFDSCADLAAGLRSHLAKSAATSPYWYYQRQYALEDLRVPVLANAGVPSSPGGAVVNGSASSSSTTNVQEIGVDEPDIVKTDGDRVVSVINGKLTVVDASTRSVVGTLDLDLYANWQAAQLLTSGDHAIVIMSGYNDMRVPVAKYIAPDQTARSTVLSIDLRGTPKVVSSLQLDGTYVDARMVGSDVRLVAVNRPNLEFTYTGTAKQIQTRNQSIIRKAPVDAWLPSYTITRDGLSETRQVPCSAVTAPAEYSGQSMLTVYTIDIANPGDDPDPISVAADAQTVYSTQSSLYVASRSCLFCEKAGTQLHRFDIRAAGSPTYLGSANVAGTLLNSYSISEYDGYLRVATTKGETASSSVYVLDAATLKQTGHVDGLGKNERIYAVRFVGSLGYVVTFRQTDPLYVIDLRDPIAPKVLGDVEVTGFSSYLHPIGDDLVLGVGQEASTQGLRTGVQVSLFDVSNPAKPALVSRVFLQNTRGGDEFDPHAFLYWEPTGTVAVPVQAYDGADSGKVLVLRVTGSTMTRVGLVANEDASISNPILRSMIVDGQLWTVSDGGIRVSNPTTLDEETWIEFG